MRVKWFLLLVGLFLPVIADARPGGPTVPVPQSTAAAPDLALRDLSGNEQSLSLYRGRIVVLNFWATWCKPCREEMPVFIALQSRYGAQGVQVIAASTDTPDKQAEVVKFAKKYKLNFPVWVGASTVEMQRFELGSALPVTAIIDRDGSIAGRIIGVVDAGSLQQRIDWLLSDRKAPAPPLTTKAAAGHKHEGEAGHDHHEGEEEHEHGAVSIEGASTVPS